MYSEQNSHSVSRRSTFACRGTDAPPVDHPRIGDDADRAHARPPHALDQRQRHAAHRPPADGVGTKCGELRVHHGGVVALERDPLAPAHARERVVAPVPAQSAHHVWILIGRGAVVRRQHAHAMPGRARVLDRLLPQQLVAASEVVRRVHAAYRQHFHARDPKIDPGVPSVTARRARDRPEPRRGPGARPRLLGSPAAPHLHRRRRHPRVRLSEAARRRPVVPARVRRAGSALRPLVVPRRAAAHGDPPRRRRPDGRRREARRSTIRTTSSPRSSRPTSPPRPTTCRRSPAERSACSATTSSATPSPPSAIPTPTRSRRRTWR